MSTVTAAIYLDRLIRLQDLKVKAVMKAAGVSDNYLSRLISGGMREPSASLLYKLTLAARGSWAHVGELMQVGATPAHAEELAEEWAAVLKQIDATPLDRRQVVAQQIAAELNRLGIATDTPDAAP